MMKGVAAALSLALLASGAQAQSLKEKYELSDRCGKQAAERFKEFGTRGDQPISYGRCAFNGRCAEHEIVRVVQSAMALFVLRVEPIGSDDGKEDVAAGRLAV